MGLEQIRARLAAFDAQVIDEPKVARAAVALVLAEVDADVDLLLIQRAIRDDDPWSGHMALPGGRRDPGDADAVATASRETHEEVGVDLRRGAEVIGRLDELRAVARHRPLDLVITPVVFALREPVTLRPSPREVESAIWVPLSFLASPHSDATYDRTLDGVTNQYPAFRYQHYTIWGLTHRILQGFLELVHDDGPVVG
jgi:8-oxo-dGTP pyrophosphatase MutT (NUDIX family)